MDNDYDIKKIVKDRYNQIALNNRCGCGCGCDPGNGIEGGSIMKDDYYNISGYIEDADLDLGCGLPTQFADIQKGDTVVDLGSGAGNDAFIARSVVGSTGYVLGIDFTPEMISKANINKKKLNYDNVEFKLGDIEDIPLENEIADVVVSNCVLNLVPDKQKAFSEIFRILKPNGHFCVSDIVTSGHMSENLRKSAELYASCISGAAQREEYLNIISDMGFKNIKIKKYKPIVIPDEILTLHLSEDEIEAFNKNDNGIFSITIYGEK